MSHNPNFNLTETSSLINQSPKLRQAYISENTKSYICSDGADKYKNPASVLVDTKTITDKISNSILKKLSPIYYFDIENNIVQAIYQSC